MYGWYNELIFIIGGIIMFRAVEDFSTEWQASSKGTLDVFHELTDETLQQAIVGGHNTLGSLAWHLTEVAMVFGNFAGLNMPTLEEGKKQPTHVSEIIDTYEAVLEAYKKGIVSLTDDALVEEIEALGGIMPRGKLLYALIQHQTHHVGQMTVLLRQAGLRVPPVMGPTAEMQ